jgi:hypothetical protein
MRFADATSHMSYACLLVPWWTDVAKTKVEFLQDSLEETCGLETYLSPTATFEEEKGETKQIKVDDTLTLDVKDNGVVRACVFKTAATTVVDPVLQSKCRQLVVVDREANKKKKVPLEGCLLQLVDTLWCE